MRNTGRILADLSRRVTVSKGALPSVCCYTVFNSNALVQSIDISSDASTGIRTLSRVCVSLLPVQLFTSAHSCTGPVLQWQ